jgi:hypothetical protein
MEHQADYIPLVETKSHADQSINEFSPTRLGLKVFGSLSDGCCRVLNCDAQLPKHLHCLNILNVWFLLQPDLFSRFS